MKRLRHTFGLAVTGMFLFVGVAAAASLGLTTGKLGAGSAAVSGCTVTVTGFGTVSATNLTAYAFSLTQ